MTEGVSPSQTGTKTPNTLKRISRSRIPSYDLSSRSDSLHGSQVPTDQGPRSFYLTKQLEGESLVPPPLISCSEFVPRSLVELLMRKKKDSAIGVKFVGRGGFRKTVTDQLDKITNLEGAMHSFVTSVVGRCEMVGDYRFAMGHGVSLFGAANEQEHLKERVWLTRTVVLSGSIQLDFEGSRVMLKASKLDNAQVVGSDLGSGWDVASIEEKQDDQKRNEYDEGLKRHMVFHLTHRGVLPPRRDVQNAMMVEDTIEFLNELIRGSRDLDQQVVDKYFELHNDTIVSLELLFNTTVHQVRNEFSALEAMCPQGYVYTYHPASIFAREIGAPILNRLMLVALKQLSDHDHFPNLRVFAFNDYTDRGIVDLAALALKKQSHVRVVRKDELFRGRDGKYDVGNFKEAEGALLVIHNNSDGFGQNIETEGPGGSLDGAVGTNSSGAASLERSRADLLDFVC